MSEEHALPTTGNGTRILMAIIWPWVMMISLIVIGSVGMVLGVAYMSGAEADIAHVIGQGQSINRMVALVVIITATVILAVIERLNGVAGTLLGSIAGYVLGGLAAAPAGP